MPEVSVTIKEPLTKGLAPANNKRNQPYLTQSTGAIPNNDVLAALESFSVIDTSALTLTFPYPQLFVLSDCIIICTSTAIYEYSGSSLSLKISGLTAGVPWECLDFNTYVMLTNGKQTVTKDAVSGAYSVSATLPHATATCNYNGQVLIGSPDVEASGTI